MSDWLLAMVGMPAGHQLALGLALMTAVLHALFGALQKRRHDPWLSRATIDASTALMAAPFALFVVPWPEPHMWPIFAGAFGLHAVYKLLQAMAYARGAYTVVYPVVRGTGPLFPVIGAGLLLGEVYAPLQWLGVLVLVAVYTTCDAWGICATADPFTFLAWFFLVDGLFIPAVTFRVWRGLWRDQIAPVLRRGVFGACSQRWWPSPRSGRSWWRPGWIRSAKSRCCAKPRQCLPP